MKIDHVHFYVDNATQWRNWFVHYLGFNAIGTTYTEQTCTAVANSQSVYVVLSSPLTPESPVAQYLQKHPPGVADIAFCVDDLDLVINQVKKIGTKVLQPIQEQQGLKWAKILGWGDLCHTLIESNHQSQYAIFPDSQNLRVWEKTKKDQDQRRVQTISHIDHIVLNVASGELAAAVDWYQQALGFQPRQRFSIQTERSGLYSQVLVCDRVTLPINEPTSENSQIQEFININQGAGIQHIALYTDNILSAVHHSRRLGLSFIDVPGNYYQHLQQRGRLRGLNLSAQQWQRIQAEKILVDWQAEQPEALLMQTFTQPIFNQPTFFFELISRQRNAQGFGEGNFQALFEAVEREQLQRTARSQD